MKQNNEFKFNRSSLKQIMEVEEYMDLRHIVIHENRRNLPLMLSPDLTIIVEKFNPLYEATYEFLMSISEPLNRSEYIHEYKITQMSLYTSMVLQYSSQDIIRALELISKNSCPPQMKNFIEIQTKYNGCAKFYLDQYYYLDLWEELSDLLLSRLQNKNCLIEIETVQNVIHHNPEVRNLEVMMIDQLTYNNMVAEIDTNIDYQRILDQKKFKKYRIDGDYFDVTSALIKCNIPLIQEYEFMNEQRQLEINLKPECKPRIYQARAVKNVIIENRARSGLIVLPCGAGKTMVGIMCITQIKSSTIIICDSNVSVDQWRKEIEKNTTIDHKNIVRVSGFVKDQFPEPPFIVLTTYSWLIAQMQPYKNNPAWRKIQETKWGVCIVDEVHRLPALQFCNVLRAIKCAIKIGLTATLLREDQKLDNLFFMIGPKLYEENLIDLMKQGYLARPHIVEILCEMTDIFENEYRTRPHQVRQLLHSGNPKKFKVLQFLIQHHEILNHKIIVFCDSLLILNYYAEKLGYPVIDGDLNTDEKNKIFGIFKNSTEIKTIFVSRVGDTGIDIPMASVGIEIGYLGGSRRQKVQRLGRVMRPKKNPNNDISAFFYSLASKGTSESEYSYKRQKYITDQLGLNTELINELDLPYNSHPERYKHIKSANELELLEKILMSCKNTKEIRIEPNEYEEHELGIDDLMAGMYKFE